MDASVTVKELVGFQPLRNFSNNTTADEVKNAYNGWATSYDEDIKKTGYLGLYSLVSEFCGAMYDCGLDQDSRILDVGAGTGCVGLHLNSLGYKHVDALDISQNMLEASNKKHIYKQFINAGLGFGSPVVASLSYDAAISSACFTLGHIKAEALHELANLVRKGGIIAFNSRQDVIENETIGYAGTIKELEDNKTWKVLTKKKTIYYMYPFGDSRARYCYLYVIEKL